MSALFPSELVVPGARFVSTVTRAEALAFAQGSLFMKMRLLRPNSYRWLVSRRGRASKAHMN